MGPFRRAHDPSFHWTAGSLVVACLIAWVSFVVFDKPVIGWLVFGLALIFGFLWAYLSGFRFKARLYRLPLEDPADVLARTQAEGAKEAILKLYRGEGARAFAAVIELSERVIELAQEAEEPCATVGKFLGLDCVRGLQNGEFWLRAILEEDLEPVLADVRKSPRYEPAFEDYLRRERTSHRTSQDFQTALGSVYAEYRMAAALAAQLGLGVGLDTSQRVWRKWKKWDEEFARSLRGVAASSSMPVLREKVERLGIEWD